MLLTRITTANLLAVRKIRIAAPKLPFRFCVVAANFHPKCSLAVPFKGSSYEIVQCKVERITLVRPATATVCSTRGPCFLAASVQDYFSFRPPVNMIISPILVFSAT